MNEKKKDLLVIYLNEFNYDFLLKGAKKYKCKSILEILNFKKVKTYTEDKKQNFNLDPWVQSVSINTGKSSKTHKILKLGQPISKNLVQIWDKLSENKISSSVWGAMNSKFKKNKFIDYYFPDPWNYRDSTWPKNLMGLYYLPNYYAKNYLKFNFFKFFFYSIIFISTLFFNIKLVSFFKDSFFSLNLFLKRGIKNFILFFLFDLIFLSTFQFTSLKKKSSFSMIFLNSIAHYQHNNWNEQKNEKYFFLFVEKLCFKILLLKKQFNSTIIFNGFSQKKINAEYLIRPKNPKGFLLNFIKFKRLEQDMTNGGFIFFHDKKEKKEAINILSRLYCNDKKIFDIKIYQKDYIFYKINLKSIHILRNYDQKNINNFNKKSLIEIKKSKLVKKKNTKNIANYFFNRISFIKTTGIHVPEGLILYENFDALKGNRKIKNQEIFSLICKHFKIK
tara:strand:+ start:2067 stop:3407 length:1341 start_codon:yes stop_codon:yes gene_type:complete